MARLPILPNRLPELERKIHAALEARRTADPQLGGLRLSRIGECVRRLWAEQRQLGGETPDGRALAIFRTGDAVEWLVIDWLEAAGYKVESRQFGVEMEVPEHTSEDSAYVVQIQGHIDGLIQWHGETALLEIKSANARNFAECQAKGYAVWKPAYADQVQAYLGAAALPVAICVVFNKDTSELYAEKIRANPAEYARLQDKARTVLTAEAAPERPYASQSAAPCRWCYLAETCYSPAWEVRFDD